MVSSEKNIKTFRNNNVPKKVTLDKSGANKSAMDEVNANRKIPIAVRQIKYLNNIIEQDYRAVKRMTQPMLGFKSFYAAKVILSGVELMRMIRKGQLRVRDQERMSFSDQFFN
jgi:putative transposase